MADTDPVSNAAASQGVSPFTGELLNRALTNSLATVQGTVNQAAGPADPVSNAVGSPEASLFARELLIRALANPTGAPPDFVPQAQALLANVLMNDVMNSWNNVGQHQITDAETRVNQAIGANPPRPVLALAQHAQGLIHRARRNHSGALSAFQQAVSSNPGFARGQAQLANQQVLSGGNTTQARAQIQTVIGQNPLHPASGYFYWSMGRAYFIDRDWRNAITWLSKSVAALSTVWYNQHYLAVAKQNAGDSPGAITTLQQFINDPQFGDPQLGKQKVQRFVPPAATNPNNDPVIAAQQNLRTGLLAVLANLP
jgi:tetratricopeptide (TPR) repeat protein